MDELEKKLEILWAACEDDEDDGVREAMRKVVPTFRRPEEVNREACGVVERNDNHKANKKSNKEADKEVALAM